MRIGDLIRFDLQVLQRHRWRTVMMLVAMAIGVTAVNLLTGLGEGARGFVLGEFRALDKNVLIVLPGRKETTGGMPPIMGTAPRNLTLADATALARVPGVWRVAPLIIGSTDVESERRHRDTVVVGTSAAYFDIRQVSVQRGSRLPELPLQQAQPVCVIGQTIQRELFGNQSAVGQTLRVGEQRFRVIGVLGGKGQAMGMNYDEALLMPIASAQQVFNQEGLFRVLIELVPGASLATTRERVLQRLEVLHQGDRDVTVITQDAVLAAFDGILATLTVAVAGIGGISLLVAGVLIMNVTMIGVSQRTAEIGLLKALGASEGDVLAIFLAESAVLATAGALIGLVLGHVLLTLACWKWPDIPFATPWWAALASVSVAILTALGFAWLPSRRAAAMNPVLALQSGRMS